MKKRFLKSFCARCLTLLVLALLSTNLAWGETVTYTMQSYSQNVITSDNDATWTTSSACGGSELPYALNSKRGAGFQANNTVTSSFTVTNASKISVVASSNGSKTTTLTVKVGNTQFGEKISVKKENYQTLEFTAPNNTIVSGNIEFTITRSDKTLWIGQVIVETRKTLSSIAVKTAPTTTSYNVGDKFNPAGLIVTGTYDDKSTEDIAYEGNESDFTFSPDLNTALTTSNTSVTITYGGKETTQTITVNKIATSLAWSVSSCEATISEQNEYPTLTTTPANLEGVTYSSSNTDVATIDATTGVIKLITEGETTITASFAGDDTYQPATDATYTLTVKQSSDTRTPVNITNVSAGQTTLVNGETTTLTVTNDQLDWTPSYIYESNNTDVAIVSTDGVITAVGKGAATITVTLNIEETDPSYRKGETPSMEIEITVNNPSHTAKFSVNGVIDESMNFTAEKGNKISFPGNPSAIDKYVFKGWLSTTLEPQQSEPTYIDTEDVTMGTEDITYYAVFVKKEGTEPTLTKLGKDATFSNDDNIVIVATGTTDEKDWAKALYQETVSKSYVNFYEFNDDVTKIMDDEKNYVTLTTGSVDGTWKLGDATNGYVYNGSSNDLTVDKENSSNWTIAWDESKSKYSIKNGTRWLSCRSDLTGDNQYKFRGGGTTTVNGTVYFDIYKLIKGTVTFSNYCTFIPAEVTITAAKYATLGLPYAVTIPEGVSAYTASVSGNKVTLSKINKSEGGSNIIPANCGVVLYADVNETTTYAFYRTTTDESYNDNKLVAVIGEPYTCADYGRDYYLGKDTDGKVTFIKLAQTGNIPAGKAYLKLDAEADAKLEVTFNDEPTGIKDIQGSKMNIQGSAYNLNGVRVNENYKGIVIMNGKKYINK